MTEPVGSRNRSATLRCPKCGEPRVASGSCSKCGLKTERMPVYAEGLDAKAGEEVRASWDRAVVEWETPARHDELLQLVVKHDSYAWVANRYRDAAREHPDDPIARRQLDRLQRAAEATLLASAAARPDNTPAPYRSAALLLGLLIVAIVVGLAYALLKAPDPDPTEVPATQLSPATPPVAPGSQTR